jgi:hypothetical protein
MKKNGLEVLEKLYILNMIINLMEYKNFLFNHGLNLLVVQIELLGLLVITLIVIIILKMLLQMEIDP